MPGEVLVGVPVLRTGVDAPVTRRAVSKADLVLQQIETVASAQTISQNTAIGFVRLRLSAGQTVEEAIVKLQASGLVSYAEPNYYRHAFSTPSDTYYASKQWGPQKIAAEQAWEIWSPKVPTVIAIIDSGVRLDHPDLVNKLYKDGSGNIVQFNFISSTYDSAQPNRYTSAADDHGHGTHCSGIAAAQINNGVGVAGIAGWTGATDATDTDGTRIMPIKVLDFTGSGDDSGVASAVTWAADHGARVASMSLGGAAPSQSMDDAIAYAISKNCVVTAAAGNGDTTTKSYPGACPGVLSVASTEYNDTFSGFSNYGDWVTVAAPGGGIYSTALYDDPDTHVPYRYSSGTSMATPHVAGELALLASQNPGLSSLQLFALVQDNTDPIAPDGRKFVISGRINAFKALTAATLWSPGNFSAAANSRSLVTLSWQDTTSVEDGFSLEMSTNGTTYTTIGTVGMNKTTTTVSGLARSTKYYFRLRAFTRSTMGTYSAPAIVTTKAF